MERKIIELDQGWDYMQKGITKLKRILEGLPEAQFNSEEYMMLYTYPLLRLLHLLFKILLYMFVLLLLFAPLCLFWSQFLVCCEVKFP